MKLITERNSQRVTSKLKYIAREVQKHIVHKHG